MIDECSNPFATKFLSAGRLPFIGLCENTLDRLAETLIRQGCHGQIVGPHGVGKTTLTFEIEKRMERLRGTGTAFKFIRKTIGSRGGVRLARSSMSGDFLTSDSSPAMGFNKTILVLDGVERLSWFQRLALLKSCQRKRIGLLITSHRRIWGVPILVELDPDLSRFESVFKTLTTDNDFQLSSARLNEIFCDNEGNMREALMTCYDEFEASRAKTVC